MESFFEQAAFKEALPAVSKARLEQTLYAEFPHLKASIEALREQKATQSIASLATIWRVTETEALAKVKELEAVGFLEAFGGTWRVPFLYRPALALVQGAAD